MARPALTHTKLHQEFGLYIAELSDTFGYNSDMLAGIFLSGFSGYEFHRLVENNEIETHSNLVLLRARIERERWKRDRAQKPRAVPSKTTDQRLVEKKRADTEQRIAAKKGGPEVGKKEEPGRPDQASMECLAAINFMIATLGLSQPEISKQIFGDPHGKWLTNRRYRIDTIKRSIDEDSIEAIHTKFVEIFGFPVAHLPGKKPEDFQHLSKQFTKGSQEAPASKPAKPEERESQPPPPAPAVPSPPSGVHIDDDIEDLRQTLIRARVRAGQLAEQLPSFGGIRGKMSELESWLDGTLKEWWPEEGGTQ